MLKLKYFSAFILIIATFLLASQVIIGINQNILPVWRFWYNQNGQWKEQLLIFNPYDSPKKLSIYIIRIVNNGLTLSFKDDTTQDRNFFSYLINPHSVKKLTFPFDKSYNFGRNLYRFSLDDRDIGLMNLYRKRPHKKVTARIVTTIDSIAQNKNYSIWFEQEKYIYNESSLFTVKLKLKNRITDQSKSINKLFIELNHLGRKVSEQRKTTIKIISIKNNSLIVKNEQLENDEREILEFQIPENKHFETHCIEIKINVEKIGKSRVDYLKTWYDIGKNRFKFLLPIFINKA